jgi:hypothetical protein
VGSIKASKPKIGAGMIGITKNMTGTIPMCWKCADSKTEAAPENSGAVFVGESKILHLVGCKAEAKIKNYKDAEVFCPLLSKTET